MTLFDPRDFMKKHKTYFQMVIFLALTFLLIFATFAIWLEKSGFIF